MVTKKKVENKGLIKENTIEQKSSFKEANVDSSMNSSVSPIESSYVKNNKDSVNENNVNSEVETDSNSYGLEESVLDSNEVYDEGDIASKIEMNFIAQALGRHKEKMAVETHPDFDGKTCIECGEDIPLARLNLKKIRCVDCQSELELKNKLYGR